jgi:TM2 domain-containing membrane protein YozV
MTRQQSMTAIGLEAAPGTFLMTFGVGHLYAGRVGTGLLLMVTYWALQGVNLLLMPFMIGWFTFALTWLLYLVFSTTDLLDSGGQR